MKRYSGRVMTKNPVTPTLSSAPGIWTLEEAMQYTKAGTWPGLGNVYYSSRSTGTTEGLTSNFASSSSGIQTSWNYGGNNADMITITTSGATAKLQGFTICNYYSSGSNSFTFRMVVISGSSTNGTILKQETFIARALSTGQFQTMILFSDGGISLAPGTYTIGFVWDTSQGSATTYTRAPSINRSTSSISNGTSTLSVTYLDATFAGAPPLGTTNGTGAASYNNGQGQVVTLQWFF